jgi:DNA-binding MarR family transcriptional regulator
MLNEISKEDRVATTALTVAINTYLDSGASLPTMPAFLAVTRHPGKSCSELSRLEDVPLPSISRHLMTLGHQNLALVQTQAAGREVLHSLTPKGLALAARIIGAARKIGAA